MLELLERLKTWQESGSAAVLAQVVGLDLGGRTPEETAVSVMAELVALRYGRSGGRLSERTGAVHEGQ